MKIFNFGLDISPGKYKYNGEYFDKLVEKFSPAKEFAYTVEFIDKTPPLKVSGGSTCARKGIPVDKQIEKADAIVFDLAKKADLILIDLEKQEKRSSNTESEVERTFLSRIQKILEEEKLLCDVEFSEEEKNILKTLQFVTYKPCLGKEPRDTENINELIKEVVDKSGILLFFTAAKKEVHTWSVRKGDNVLEAAGKIHSDLKRGFIKAEVVNCRDLDNFFNWAEAKSKGFVKIVGKDYIMQENDIIEIRFSV